ncbi:MAG: hypothetical protein M1305_05580 [Candidatus Marsarchaeota archaeon]|nr:hypothetical protein [Candidatus Marsarchaeota archaeon]
MDKLNRKAMAVSFAVTLGLGFVGLVLQAVYLLNLAPPVGGISAGYVVGVS